MSQHTLRRAALTGLIALTGSTLLLAQAPTVEAYHVRVVTDRGKRFGGILDAVTDQYLTLDAEATSRRGSTGLIPLGSIRKVVIRRNNNRGAVLTGAILGGLAVGLIVNNSIRQSPSPPSNSFLYGIAVTFSAAAGAAGGAILGSAAGRLTSRVIRPLPIPDPVLGLKRQLEPFSRRYQQELLNGRFDDSP